MFAVVVTFKIVPDDWDRFLPLMHQNAATSLSIEPGCQRFDVCTDPDRPHEVFLYELYTDRAAFDGHLTSDHFKAFDTATAGMIAAKQVATYTQVQS